MLEVKLFTTWNYKGQKGKETFFHTAIGSFLTGMSDWGPGFRAMIDEVLEPAVDEQFASQGHGTWAALAPSTLKGKKTDEMLVESGRMRSSFRKGSGDNVSEVFRDRMRWGSRVPYSLFHQTGTGSGFQKLVSGGGRGMPMRKIIDLSSTHKAALRSILVSRLANIARKEGFGVLGSGADPWTARKIGKTLLGL